MAGARCFAKQPVGAMYRTIAQFKNYLRIQQVLVLRGLATEKLQLLIFLW
jgi:hypothetical protein